MLRFELSQRLGPCSVCGCVLDSRNSIPRWDLPRLHLDPASVDGDACLRAAICPICAEHRPDLIGESNYLRARAALVALGWRLPPLLCPPASAALPFDW